MSVAPDKTTSPFGEPAWDIARLFPAQGQWSEEDYLQVPGNALVEFSDGNVEVLPMPTVSHQRITAFFYRALLAFLSARPIGEALFAPVRVRLWPGKFREPDVVFMLAEHSDRITDPFWIGADLVIEVVSDENRRHDLETKRREYARAGIPEYWIVDPRDATITVLALEGDSYAVHGEFAPGNRATSRLLPGFSVAVAESLASAD